MSTVSTVIRSSLVHVCTCVLTAAKSLASTSRDERTRALKIDLYGDHIKEVQQAVNHFTNTLNAAKLGRKQMYALLVLYWTIHAEVLVMLYRFLRNHEHAV